VIIADTKGEIIGKQLSTSELESGEPLQGNNVFLGTLIVVPGDLIGAVNPAEEFLSTVNQAIISSAIIASVIAFILGALLFLQITSPLQQLKTAASAIASGDLNKRVHIRSRDELGELSQAFNQMAQSLADAETQRKHLVADVAHELRTPLAAIQGTLEGMQDGVLPLDTEQITALHAETMLLNRLINDLRLISLAEAGQLKLEQGEVQTDEFIQQVVERMRPQAEQKKIHLAANIAPGLPPVWIDSDRITQVLHNLISNALRYTPPGGAIQVETQPDSALPQFLRVSVTDTGQGIDPQDLPHVFDRFYRSDKSRARSSGGSGLGLAIVRQLIEAHGGSVWAESPVFTDSEHAPSGTRISFTLPALRMRSG
jgi:two-component system OmpR family sensor kinase/two-component system sensor histidine kinase BaeS